MRRWLKRVGLAVAGLALLAFLAFLYFIPPFTIAPPETFSDPVARAGPPIEGIADEGSRAIAERGRYLVRIGSCSDCHSTPGPQGPRMDDMYLAGGFKMMRKDFGTYVSMNLTPDKDTGLGSYSDEEIKRVLRSGVSKDGSRVPGHLMPWPGYSNWTDEDLYAVIAYLRQTTPVTHRIPPAAPETFSDATAIEEIHGGKDYADFAERQR